MSQEEKMENGWDASLSNKVAPMKSAAETGNAFQNIRNSENIYYNMYAATNRRWTGMISLLFRWKRSVFKLVWHDIIIFLVIYFLLSILYRYVLFDYPSYKQTFEMICIYADRFRSSIPITFLIGFWVSQIVSRWWDQFMTLPHPDSLALKLVAFIPGRVSKLNVVKALVFYKIVKPFDLFIYIFYLYSGTVSKTPSTGGHALRKFVIHTCIKAYLREG